jgi:hypothetical protein
MSGQPSGAGGRADVVAFVCDDVRTAVADLLRVVRGGEERHPDGLVGRIERLAALVEDLAVLAGREPAGGTGTPTGGSFDLAYAPGDAATGGERRLRLAAESG